MRRLLCSAVVGVLLGSAVIAQQQGNGGGGTTSPFASQFSLTQQLSSSIDSVTGNGPANATLAIGTSNTGFYYNTQGGNNRLELEVDGKKILTFRASGVDWPITASISWSTSHDPFDTLKGQLGLDDDGASSYALEEGFGLGGNPQHRFYYVANASDTGNFERLVTAGTTGVAKLNLESGGSGSANIDLQLNTLGTGIVRVFKAFQIARNGAVTFANLPASPAEGMMMAVSDSNTATWGATIAGNGANHVLAYYDGTNWTVAAK